MRRIAGNQQNLDRHPTDLYPTDDRWTHVLLRRIQLRGPVWECAAGDGRMANVLKSAGYSVRSSDILTGTDFLAVEDEWAGSIVTNPPYRHALEFVNHALSLATEQVAMLLPIGWLGGQGRYRSLWRVSSPHLVISVVNRMPIVGGGISQFNHVWCVWDRDRGGGTELVWDLASHDASCGSGQKLGYDQQS